MTQPQIGLGWTRVLSAAQRDEVVERYIAGAYMTEIAREFNVSQSTIKRCLVDAHVPLRPHASRRSDSMFEGGGE